MTISTFETFLQHLDIPKACELNKPVFKKLFLDSGELNATDKKCLTDDVKKLRWLYTLKPSTINIASYQDQVREYPEVAVLQIELASPQRISRIANFVNRSIPYPLVLLFTLEIDNKTSVAISLTDKRINQSDKEKWVLEDSIHSSWIYLGNPQQPQAEFLASLRLTDLPFNNFWVLYQALIARVIASNCAIHTGLYNLGDNKQNEGSLRLKNLRELEKLSTQKAEIANKLKKQKQMGKQVELNTEIKRINDRIAEIKGSL